MVCFANNGYHQTTMEDIVQEAGLSKGGLYVHFSSKKELFIALIECFIDEFSFFPTSAITGPTTYERLTGILSGMVATIASDTFRETSSLMTDVWAQNSRDQDINQVVLRLYAQVRYPLTQLINEGIADGTFKPIDANALANILIAVFEGLIIQDMVDESSVDWTAVSGTLDSLIAGQLMDGDQRTQ